MADMAELSPAQRRVLDNFERQIKEERQRLEAQTPAHIRQLGKILRRSIAKDTTVKFRRFLKKHGIHIPRRDLEHFRDHLIVNRVDLKDLEPAARERLRARTLAKEDPKNMSVDYRREIAGGQLPHCRDCRWFVVAPNDGEPAGDKACVEFGTKGADTACYGFAVAPN